MRTRLAEALWKEHEASIATDTPLGRVGEPEDAVTAWIATLDVGAEGPLWVLRRPPLGHLLASAHDIEREHRILSGLQDTDLPIARVRTCEDPAVTDAPLRLMEHFDGLVVEDMATAEALTPERRGEIGRSMATTLARVHGIDLKRTGLETYARRSPRRPRRPARVLAADRRPGAGGVPGPGPARLPEPSGHGRSLLRGDGQSLDALGFWHVLGLWKIAIIAEGVLRRAQVEPRNAASGCGLTTKTVDDLVIRAQAIAAQAGL